MQCAVRPSEAPSPPSSSLLLSSESFHSFLNRLGRIAGNDVHRNHHFAVDRLSTFQEEFDDCVSYHAVKHGIERPDVLLDRAMLVVLEETTVIKLRVDLTVPKIQNKGKHHRHPIIEEQHSSRAFMDRIHTHLAKVAVRLEALLAQAKLSREYHRP